MKNRINVPKARLFGIIALVAIIGFSMPSCGNSGSGDPSSPGHTHTYSATWSSNGTQHWKECTVTGCDVKSEIANHSPANGICSTCGYDNTTAHTHTLTKTDAVAATHTIPGNPDYWTCSGCGKYYADASGATELTATQIVIAAGHQYTAGICTVAGCYFIEMMSIPQGTFTMGPDMMNDDATIEVTLSAFKMSKYTVTQELYQAVMGNNPSYFNSSPHGEEVQSKRPVERVTWYDAVDFCNKLSVREELDPVYELTGITKSGDSITAATVTADWTKNGYRLPTDAQWEYACREGKSTEEYWHFGDDDTKVTEYAWTDDNSNSMTHKSGLLKPNAYGLYDMYGNVSEWCWDLYADYPAGPETDYKGPAVGQYGISRVFRNGSWSEWSWNTVSVYRDFISPNTASGGIGFRVVCP